MSPSDEGVSVPAFLEFCKTVCRQAQRVSVEERWETYLTRRGSPQPAVGWVGYPRRT